jgi:hypothetical protein
MLLTPFEGDRFLFAEIVRLCAVHKIKTIVETGTQYGSTTRALALLADQVVTVEMASFSVFGLPPNVLPLHMDSPEALRMVLPDIARPALFYLDAHGPDKTPLLEELSVLTKQVLFDCPIVIHDFQVPGKDFGFDQYGDQTVNLKFISEVISPLINAGFSIVYNSQVEGARRGACFLIPKKE